VSLLMDALRKAEKEKKDAELRRKTEAGELQTEVRKPGVPTGTGRSALDITDEEARKILANAASRTDDAYYAVGEVLCPKYTYVGWTTHGHAGGDISIARL